MPDRVPRKSAGASFSREEVLWLDQVLRMVRMGGKGRPGLMERREAGSILRKCQTGKTFIERQKALRAAHGLK